MNLIYETLLQTYQREARKAAKDLGYGKKVIERINEAKTEGEIQRIMIKARKEKFGD